MADFTTTNTGTAPNYNDPYAATSGGLGDMSAYGGSSASLGNRQNTSGGSSTSSNSGGVNLFSQNTAFLPFNYASGSSLGSMSLNIPTSFLGGNGSGSGLNLNIDFGPNADTIAKNAYAYDAVQAQNDFAFLGSAIKQTQNFVGGMLSPAISAVAQDSGGSFFDNLLSAFGVVTTGQSNLNNAAINSMNSNYAMAIPAMNMNVSNALNSINNTATLQSQVSLAAIQASQATSQASIAASQSAANNSGGGCYITTAVCEYAGKKDDCEILTLLRDWRDRFVASGQLGRDCIAMYYRDAPKIVDAIRARADCEIAFARIRRYVRRAASAIRHGNDALALIYYVRGIALAKEYANV